MSTYRDALRKKLKEDIEKNTSSKSESTKQKKTDNDTRNSLRENLRKEVAKEENRKNSYGSSALDLASEMVRSNTASLNAERTSRNSSLGSSFMDSVISASESSHNKLLYEQKLEHLKKLVEEREREDWVEASTRSATTTDLEIDDIDKNINSLKNKIEKAQGYRDIMSEYEASFGDPSTIAEYNEALTSAASILGVGKSSRDITQAIKTAKRDLEKYETEKKKYKYNERMNEDYSDIQNSDELEALATKGGNTLPSYTSIADVRNMSDAEVAALYVNSDDDTRNLISKIYEYPGLLDNYKYIDDQQKQMFNAIRARDGEEAGYQYLKDIDPVLLRKGYFTQQADLEQKITDSAVDATAHNIGTVLTAPIKGFDYIGSLVENAFDSGDELGGVSSYIMNPSNASNIVRTTTAENISNPVLKFAYNTGMSILDNVMTIATSGALGLPAGSSGAQAATLAMMGGGAASQSYSSAKAKGLTEDEALAVGFMSGALETITESIGLENLFSIIQKEGGRAGMELAKAVASQMGAEGAEELLAELGNTFVDSIVAGDLSNYKRAVEWYMQNGMSEEGAKKKATTDWFKQVGEAFLAGFASGGVMGSGGTAINNYRYNKESGQELIDTFGYDRLRELALETVNKGGRNGRIKSMVDSIDKRQNPEAFVERNPIRAKQLVDVSNRTLEKQVSRADEITEALKKDTPLTDSTIKKIKNSIVSDVVNGREFSSEKYEDIIDQYTFTDANENGVSAKKSSILDTVQKQYEQKKAEYDARVKTRNEILYGDEQYAPSEAAAIEKAKTVTPEVNTQPVTEAQPATQVETKQAVSTENADISRVLATVGESTTKINAVMSIYSAARAGVDIQTAVSDTLNANELTQGQIDNAYRAGLIAANEANIKSKSQIVSQAKTNKVGVVRDYSGSVKGKHASIRALDGVAKHLNKTVHLVDSIDAISGFDGRTSAKVYRRIGGEGNANAFFNTQTGEYFVALDSVDQSYLLVAVHESVHDGSQNNREGYENLAKITGEVLAKNGFEVQPFDNEQSLEEFMCNTVPVILTDKATVDEFVSRIIGADVSTRNAFQRFIDRVYNAIMQAYESLKNDPQWSQMEKLRNDLEGIKKIRDAYFDMLEGTVETEAENGITIDEKSGAAVFSIKTAPQTEAEIEAAKKRLVKAGFDKQSVDNWFQSMTSIAGVILQNMETLDYESDVRYSWLKTNSDYSQGSVDFNNNCPKRVEFTALFDRLQKEFPNRVFTAEEYEAIRQIMIRKGVTVTCGPCFVEDRRQHTGEIAQKFIDELKSGELAPKFMDKVGKDTYVPTQYDLVTYKGAQELYKEHRGVYDAFIAFNNARGMASARLVEGMAEYNNQIKKWNKKTIASKNNKGGLRIFSLSDADPRIMLDVIQIVMDSAEKGLMIQGYTKKPWFAKMVKDTGMKILRSHIPLGNGVQTVNGKDVLAFDNVEGINTRDADYFDSTDSTTVGNNVIGINDRQIRAAMVTDMIDQIIPFHSSLKKSIRQQKKIAGWENYRNDQTDKNADTGKKADKQINIYTDVLKAYAEAGKPIKNKRQFVEAFLEVCKENNLTPRFSKFLNVNENGDFVYTEGYHKFLVDYKLFDKNGNILLQEPVQPVFDDNYNKKILNDYVKDSGVKVNRDDVYQEIKAEVFGLKNISNALNADEVWKLYDNPRFNRYVVNALRGPGNNEQASFRVGMVDKRIIDGLRAIGRDVSYDAEHRISDNDIRHIKNSHGIAKDGRYGIATGDIQAIPYIVNRGADVYDFPKGSKQGILYVVDGVDTTYYVEQEVSPEVFVGKQMIKAPKGEVPHAYKNVIKKEAIIASLNDTNVPQMYVQDVLQPIASDEIVSQSDRKSQGKFSLKTKSATDMFYSPMAKAVEGIKSEKIGASGVVSYLKGKGIKNEEIKWSGIAAWLEGKKSVTKQELQEFVAGSMIEMDETTIDSDTSPLTEQERNEVVKFEQQRDDLVKKVKDEWKRIVGTDVLEESEENRLPSDYIDKLKAASTAFKLKTPEGIAYKEATDAVKRMIDDSDDLFGYSNARIAFRNLQSDPEYFIEENELTAEDAAIVEKFIETRDAYTNLTDVSSSPEFKYLSKLGRDVERLESKITDYKTKNIRPTTPKWQEYTLEGGDNYREVVFRLPGSDYTNKMMDVHWGSFGMKGVIFHTRVQDFNTPSGKMLFLEEFQSDWHNELKKGGYAPDAPFGDTYHEFILKRMLREATENGYDSIGWTTSETQDERWSDGKEHPAGKGKSGFLMAFQNEYDKRAVKFMEKFGKQFGAKVQLSTLPNGTQIWSMDITDEMRKSTAGKAQPLFSKKTPSNYRSDAEIFKTAKGTTEAEKNALEVYKINRDSLAQRTSNLLMLQEKLENATKRKDKVALQAQIRRMQNDVEEFEARMNNIRGKQELQDILVRERVSEWGDFLSQFGSIKKGEQAKGTEANRDIDVPERLNKTSKVSQYARTILEAKTIPDEMIDPIRAKILEGGMSYVPESNKNLINTALKLTDSENIASAWETWDAAVRGEIKTDASITALGEALLKRAADNGDAKQTVILAAELTEMFSRAGKTLQSAKLLKRMGVAGQIAYLDRTVASINRSLKKRAKNAAGTKNVTINQDLIADLVAAESEEARDGIMAEIYQDIADQVPSTFVDKWNAWRYLAMLGNPLTHIRNVVGNAAFVPAIAAKNAVATLAEKLTLATGADFTPTKAIKVDKKYMDFAKSDFDNVKNELTGNGKYNDMDEILKKQKVFGAEWLEKVRNMNFDLLEREDGKFLRFHYQNALGQYLKANKIDLSLMSEKTLSKARAYAIMEAQKATYRNANSLATALQKASNSSREAKFILDSIVPFKKTPINILKQGINYSPAGLITTMAKGLKSVVEKGKTGEGTMTMSEFIDGMSAGTVGTGVVALGYFLAASGGLVGGLGDDEEDKLYQLTGGQGYALTFGDRTYTISWAAPIAMPFLVGASLYEFAEKSENMNPAKVLEALSLISEPLVSLSMLEGVQGVLDAAASASKEERAAKVAEEALSSYIPQLYPTVLAKIASIIDPKQRSIYVDKTDAIPDGLQTIALGIAKKIPGLSMLFMAKKNAWGEEVKSGIGERILENTISPGYYSKIEYNNVEKELGRLIEETGATGIVPTTPSKKIGDEYLTKDEYEAYSALISQPTLNLLAELIASDEYKAMEDDAKIKAIKYAHTYVGELARYAVKPDAGEGVADWIDELQNSAETPADIAKGVLEYTQEQYIDKNAKKNFWSALDNEDFKTASNYIKEQRDSGKKDTEIWSSISSKYKEKYIDLLNDGDTAGADKLAKALKDFGLENKSGEKYVTDDKIKSWKFEAEYGVSWDDRYDAYKSGELSAADLKSSLMNVEGYTANEARNKIARLDYQKAHPDVSVEDAWFDEYYDEVQSSGISVDSFINYRVKVKGINGKGKKVERLKVINSLFKTKKEKDAVYFAEGWAESTLYEDAPWYN